MTDDERQDIEKQLGKLHAEHETCTDPATRQERERLLRELAAAIETRERIEASHVDARTWLEANHEVDRILRELGDTRFSGEEL
jgi:hypothetical protein